MKNLIAYATKFGSAKVVADKVSEKLPGETDIVDIKKNQKIDISSYDKVIVGGSIRAGNLQKHVKKFVDRNLDTLKNKTLGLYVCCMSEGEDAEKYINDQYPDELVDHASATACCGGQFVFGKMNFMEKFIIKAMAKTDKDVYKMDEKSINEFAEKMAKA